MSRLAGLIRANLSLKLLSLLIAFVLWAYVIVRDNPPVVREWAVPVELRGAPEGLAVLGVSPESVRVSVRGLRRLVDRLDRQHLRVLGQLTGLEVGEHTVLLASSPLPTGLEVVSVQPVAVKVILDKVEEQSRPVSPETRGRPAEGYELGGLQARPASVKLTGASSLLTRVSRVVAECEVTGLSGPAEVNASVKPVDERGVEIAGLQSDPARVVVVVLVTHVPSTTVPIVPRVGEPPAGYVVASARPSPSTVTLTGAPSALERISEVHTEPISLEGVTGKWIFKVALALPEGVTALGVTSVSVTVTLAKSSGAAAGKENGGSAPGANSSAETPGETPAPRPGSEPASGTGSQHSAPGPEAPSPREEGPPGGGPGG